MLDTSVVSVLAPGREALLSTPLGEWLQAHRLAGQMSDGAMAQGRHPGFADVAIAALAQHAGLLLLTRNLKHFEPLGVDCADPLISLPA